MLVYSLLAISCMTFGMGLTFHLGLSLRFLLHGTFFGLILLGQGLMIHAIAADLALLDSPWLWLVTIQPIVGWIGAALVCALAPAALWLFCLGHRVTFRGTEAGKR